MTGEDATHPQHLRSDKDLEGTTREMGEEEGSRPQSSIVDEVSFMSSTLGSANIKPSSLVMCLL